MNEFMILMRLNIIIHEAPPSPEQMQEYMQQYQNWVNSIIAENKFIGGKGLSTEGKTIKKKNMVTDGPYVETKESLAGFITIRATDFDDAARIANQCPILNGEGNSVEVRMITSGS